MDFKGEVAVTAIIFNEYNEVLLTQRSATKNKWPNMWTVPGGKVQDEDFLGTPTDINNQWYHTLENAVMREVKEETGVSINNIRYVCNIAVPGSIIVSFMANYEGGIIDPQPEEVQAYAWAHPTDLGEFPLIDGIKEEILIAHEIRNGY